MTKEARVRICETVPPEKDGKLLEPVEYWCEVRDIQPNGKPNTWFYSGPKKLDKGAAEHDAVEFCAFKGVKSMFFDELTKGRVLS